MSEPRLEGTHNGKASSNGQRAARQIDARAAELHQQWATDPRWWT